jgi:hypothetical protein
MPLESGKIAITVIHRATTYAKQLIYHNMSLFSVFKPIPYACSMLQPTYSIFMYVCDDNFIPLPLTYIFILCQPDLPSLNFERFSLESLWALLLYQSLFGY